MMAAQLRSSAPQLQLRPATSATLSFSARSFDLPTLFPGSPLRRVHQPRNSNTQNVQSDHRWGKNTLLEKVGGRREDGGNDENYQDGIAYVPPHPARRHHPHQR